MFAKEECISRNLPIERFGVSVIRRANDLLHNELQCRPVASSGARELREPLMA